ncbi:MAG: hypothetical protein ACJAXX_001513, partial [Roseivirga sp.]
MKKKISIAVLVLAVIVGGIVAYQQIRLYKTKQYSPIEHATYKNDAINIEIAYS